MYNKQSLKTLSGESIVSRSAARFDGQHSWMLSNTEVFQSNLKFVTISEIP